MAVVTEYTDRTTVKASLGKTTTDRDDLIDQSILTASRFIDERAGRRFYLDDVVSARLVKRELYVDDQGEEHLGVPDIGASAGIVVETRSAGTWTTVSSANYATDPDGAIAGGRPVTDLYGDPGWLPGAGRIRVTAKWGWPSVPEEITQAATLLAARLYRRKDSPQGVMGSAEWGAIRVSRFDPDVETLVAPFILI